MNRTYTPLWQAVLGILGVVLVLLGLALAWDCAHGLHQWRGVGIDLAAGLLMIAVACFDFTRWRLNRAHSRRWTQQQNHHHH